MQNNEKRSQQQINAHTTGVGARQAKTTMPPTGGGYQDVYRFCELKKSARQKTKIDPRLKNLRDMGLNQTLLKIAETIGIDNFLAMWQILDQDERCHHDSGQLLLRIRKFRSYERHLRDRYIAAVYDVTAKSAVPKLIEDSLGEKLDSSRIWRIVNKTRTPPFVSSSSSRQQTNLDFSGS